MVMVRSPASSLATLVCSQVVAFICSFSSTASWAWE